MRPSEFQGEIRYKYITAAQLDKCLQEYRIIFMFYGSAMQSGTHHTKTYLASTKQNIFQ
jgi:hypothetical protein